MKKSFLSLALMASVLFADVASDLQKSCDGGRATACYNLGFLYAKGQGVKQNFKKAKEFFSKACDGGLQEGCTNYNILNQ